MRVIQKALTFDDVLLVPAHSTVLPREAWEFGPNGCSVHVEAGLQPGLYEAIYEAKGSPVAGLGLAAVRDFASYLKHGASNAPLRESPSLLLNSPHASNQRHASLSDQSPERSAGRAVWRRAGHDRQHTDARAAQA